LLAFNRVMAMLRRMTPAMTVLVAIVALLVLVDAVFAVKLAASHSTPPVASSAQKTAAGGHPCNHGYYVSQAAHAKKGGKSVSGVAQGNLGKNGSCTAPPPKPSDG
jgi:hypothetical protein